MSSVNDLSFLSYKELQALAAKHRVPGNIKKDLLLKILQAIKCGNNLEVTKLLTDLKKNRKKRTKRLKIMKTEEDVSLQMALTSDSPGLSTQNDSYLFPSQQQQYPFQWVGAEEEVGTSRYEDIRCNLNYNDLRQFVFYTTQGVYGNCDTNNNSTLLDEIMDLRTENTVSNCRSTLDDIHMNGTIQQQQIVQTTEGNANTKMSLLLKKMLQAPVGANLGEIASPVSTWAVDPYRMREQSPDNSETMTAKSDINENDEIWQESVTGMQTGLPCIFESETSYNDNPYYRRTDSNTYYRSIDNGIEVNSLTYDQPYQFAFSPQADVQENCRSWLASNNLDVASSTDYGVISASKLAPITSFEYQSPESLDIVNPSPGGSANIIQSNTQYSINTDQLYTSQNSILPELNLDTPRFYQSTTEYIRPQESQDYYRPINTATPSFSQDFYDPQPPPPLPPPPPQQEQQQHQQQSCDQSHCGDYAQQLAAAPIYHIELDSSNAIVPYDVGYYQEQHQQQQQPPPPPPPPSVASNQPAAPLAVDPLQQVQDQQYESYTSPATATAPATSLNNPPPAYGAGVLDPYWPHWSYADRNTVASRTGGRSLENVLNLCTPRYVDYAKLNNTCCVFSNKTPVMTLRKGFNSVPADFETRTSAGFNDTEFRHHNFNSNGLLYNDSIHIDMPTSFTPSLSMSVCVNFSGERQAEIII